MDAAASETTVIIATRNPGKIREIREAMEVPGVRLMAFDELDAFPEPEETGSTLEENALIKARALRDRFGMPALADDSGLMVDRLDGRPGVRSSRYAGPDGDSELNMELLLSELQGVPDSERSARFRCVMALCLPNGEEHVVRGECEGTILNGRRGTGGFGYDPVFLPRGFDRSMAELTVREKNSISHRGKAVREMKRVIRDALGRG